jgi:hypothetical protein
MEAFVVAEAIHIGELELVVDEEYVRREIHDLIGG